MFRTNSAPALLLLCIFAASVPSLTPGSVAAQTAASSKRDSTGIVAANRTVALSAKISGRIQDIAFEEGERVAAGEALAVMDAAELEADLAAARASLGLAKVELDHARKTEKRIDRLYKRKTASEDALDEAKYKANAAKARVLAAEAEVARAEAVVRETRLVAPFDAVVTEKHAELGQLTQPGETLFVLEDQSVLKFRTHVKERDIPFIELGQPVVVIVDALDDARLEATVTKIVPSGDDNHTFLVEATLPPTEKLYPGMFGKAQFPR